MFNLNAKGPLFAVQKLAPLINRGGSSSSRLDRQRQGDDRQRHIRSRQGRAAIFARTLAAELLPREIRVNAVMVQSIDTPILGKMFPHKQAAAQLREKMIGMVPMKRWGTSDEDRHAVLFLAFDATFTTGAELPVDGGWSQL